MTDPNKGYYFSLPIYKGGDNRIINTCNNKNNCKFCNKANIDKYIVMECEINGGNVFGVDSEYLTMCDDCFNNYIDVSNNLEESTRNKNYRYNNVRYMIKNNLFVPYI